MRISDWSSDVCSSDLAANRTPSQSQSEDQSQTQNPSPAPTWATERTHATTALVAATRSLMHAAATTDLPVDDLATARRAIESVTAELSARARDRVLRIPFDLPAQVRAAGPEAEWHTSPEETRGGKRGVRPCRSRWP